MVLGARLRRLREARLISREDAGEAIRASDSKISRLELGRTGFKRRDVADLLTLYGVTDETERAPLLALAERANESGWWQSYSDVVPGWAQGYLGMEQAAGVIRTYEAQFVPGLLQTESYARAVIGVDAASDEQCERRVELRMRRQKVLTGPNACKLWAVIDEAALCRLVGGVEVMRGQLQHLIDLFEVPHIRVQVLPFHIDDPIVGGPITLLRLPDRELTDVVYLEQLTHARYPDKPEEIDFYRHIMNRLGTVAAPPAESLEILRRILKENHRFGA